MKDMKMKTKMIVGFMIPIVLTIINVLVGMSSVRRITNSVNKNAGRRICNRSENDGRNRCGCGKIADSA